MESADTDLSYWEEIEGKSPWVWTINTPIFRESVVLHYPGDLGGGGRQVYQRIGGVQWWGTREMKE